MVAAITWRFKSSTVSSTATSVCPGRPGRLAGARIAESRRGRHRCRREHVLRAGALRRLGAGEEARERFRRAARQIAADHRVAGERHHDDRGAGDPRGDLQRVGGWRAEVLGAGEDQRRHVRQRRDGGRRGRGVRPTCARGDKAAVERRRRVEGGEVARGLRVQEADRFREPRGRGRRALPRERSLLAGRDDEQRFIGFPTGVGHARQLLAVARGDVRDEALRERLQAQQRVGVVRERGADRRRQQRAQRWVQVARQKHVEQALLGEERVVAMAEPVVDRAGQRVAAQVRDQRGQVRDGFRRDAPADVLRAELAQHAGEGLEGRDRERFRAVGGDDRVQHQRFDVLRVAFGVLEGHLGAVGGAVQHELRVAGGATQRLDVLNRFLRRERPAGCADLFRATLEDAFERASRAFERGAAQRIRGARPALVEDEQVAPVQGRRQRLGVEFAERQCGLPGAAREREHGARTLGAAGQFAADRQRDRARDHAGALERHRQVAAGELRLAGAGGEAKNRGGVRLRRRAAERQHGQRRCRRQESSSPRHAPRQ